MTPTSFAATLLDAATAPYRSAGPFAYHFARGKLGGDPVFVALLERGLVPDGARILDLGCGQGLLFAWLTAARRLYAEGRWPGNWPAAPRVEGYRGIELMPKDVERAHRALGNGCGITTGDMRSVDYGKADAVYILDVLHYLDYAAQEDVLRRVHAALPAGGRFVTRVGDAAAGLPFRLGTWVDWTVMFVRGHGFIRLYCRPLHDWQALLERFGFSVAAVPMSAGTPFANVMLDARRR